MFRYFLLLFMFEIYLFHFAVIPLVFLQLGKEWKNNIYFIHLVDVFYDAHQQSSLSRPLFFISVF
jgi:hypothetical protein